MSRLDDHVAAVRNRIAMKLFIATLARLSVVYACVIWVAVVIDRIFQKTLPRPDLWFYAGLAVMVVLALAYAIRRRPSARDAAVPIDQKLGLKEKIGTALFIRSSNDPFAQAVVKDAEESAQKVVLKLNEHFPIEFPRPVLATCAIALVAWASFRYLNPDDFFNRREQKAHAATVQEKLDRAVSSVKQAQATVAAMPVTVENKESIELAKAELASALTKAAADPDKAARTAVRAMQDLNQALSEQMKNNAKYAQAQNEMKMVRAMEKPSEGQGPVADAHRAIADGKFTEAIQDLEKAVENFDKLDKADQQKAADQMKQMAQQLQQMANKDEQKKMEQQLQQMGMNQQQAQQAMQQMQQAAQGDKQAQQQLQQMAQQAMQQAGMNQQQQQQMQQQLQQMQAQANAQQQAQQMQQAAQQMAQAMQQAAQNQQGQQQANQQGQQNQQGQPQQGQGQQGQQGQGQNQGMQQAMASMQQQLQNMQAQAQDAQQIAAAQQAAQQGQANAQQAMNGAQGGDKANMQGNKPGGNGNGQWNNNNNRNFQGPNNGMGGGGVGAGDRTQKAQAPYQVKQEIDPSQENDAGRILASNFIKDNNPLKGKSEQTLKEVIDKVQAEQTDEIDQERVGRQAQNAVKEYFKTVVNDPNAK